MGAAKRKVNLRPGGRPRNHFPPAIRLISEKIPQCQRRNRHRQHESTGHDFFVFARRIAKTTSSSAIIIFASFPRNDESKIPGMAVRIKTAANTADVMSDTLLFALKKPISPPTRSRMM